MKRKRENKKKWKSFDRRIAVDWMHCHGVTVSGTWFEVQCLGRSLCRECYDSQTVNWQMSHAEMNWLTIYQFVTLYWINLINVVDEIGTETETKLKQKMKHKTDCNCNWVILENWNINMKLK